jgi:hypothetical protein
VVVAHKRKITAGAIAGAGLLGTLIALGQDSGPPRPRAIMPPPASESAPLSPVVPAPAAKKTDETPPAAPDAVPLPASVTQPKEPILPVQHIETKVEPKNSIDLKNAFPPLPVAPFPPAPLPKENPPAPLPPIMTDKALPKLPLPAPLPPIPPNNDILPPPAAPPLTPADVAPRMAAPPALPGMPPPMTPLPAATQPAAAERLVPPPVAPPAQDATKESPPRPLPIAEPEPKIQRPDTATAPPQPWTPTDTPPPPKVAPESPRAPLMIETAPPRAVPAIPANNPAPSTDGNASRFTVPAKSATSQPGAPVPQANVAAPAYAPPPDGLYRFQPVARPAVANKVPGTLPKLIDVARPTAPDLPAPAHDPALGTPTPQLTVEKRGPLFHKIGGPLQYQIIVRNVGGIAAQQVRIEDEVPGAQLLKTIPALTHQQNDRLVWILPALRPGEERTFVEELQPVRAGEVVSTTSVHVYASTSFRTKLDGEVSPSITSPPTLSSQPNLTTTPLPVLQPQTPTLIVPPATTAPNPFPPPAAMTPSVPAIPTSQGPTLMPAPKQDPVPQAPAGPIPMTVQVQALPKVAVGKTLVFEVIVSNTSAAPLTGMVLYGKLPDAFSHPRGDNIYADLDDMKPGETKIWRMPVTAVRPGKHIVEIRVTAAPNHELVARPVVTVEGSAAPSSPPVQQSVNTNVNPAESSSSLKVDVISRSNEPIEEGGETVFQVRVTNVGGAVATNVRTTIQLSPGLEPGTHAQAPTAYRINANNFVIAPIPRMQPGETKNIFVGVRGVVAGPQSVRAQVVSDQLRTPVSREQRTEVYRDR